MDTEFNYSDPSVQFGKTTDTPSISYIQVLEIDQNIINVPYSNNMITIKQLLDFYWNVTSFRQRFQSSPCLRFLVGRHKKKIAKDSQFLYSLGDDLKKQVCFRVQDKEHPQVVGSDNQLQKNKSEIDNDKADLAVLSFSLTGKKIQHEIPKATKISKIKEKLKNIYGELRTVQSDRIFLKNNTTLLDNQKKIQDYNMIDQIKIFVRRSQGSYKGTTQVLLPSKKSKLISELKQGDSILTFNRTSLDLQQSVINQISQTILTQSVKIRLKNGLELQTTPNHMLLCQDGIFRLIKSKDPKELCLQPGQRLKLLNDTSSQITQIQTKCIPPEIFFYISSDKNKNIIVNKGIVSHHQFIKIKTAQGIIIPIDINSTDSFKDVKMKIEICYNLNSQFQHLVYCMKKLKDQETISDKLIPHGAVVNLKVADFHQQQTVLYPQNTLWTSLAGQSKLSLAKESIKGTILMTTDQKHKILQAGLVIKKTENVDIDAHIAFLLDEQEEKVLRVSKDTNLLLDDDTIIQAGEFYEQYQEYSRRFWPKLKSVSKGGSITIKDMDLVPDKTSFQKIETDSHNFIANQAIIPNHIFSFIAIPTGAKRQRITLNIPKTTTIKEIKAILEPKINMQMEHQYFSFNNERLKDGDTLEDLHIQGQHVIIVRQKDDKLYKSPTHESLINHQIKEQSQQKKITLQFNQKQKCILEFSLFKKWLIKDILKQYMDTDDPSCFGLFSDKILFSNEPLQKLADAVSFDEPNCTVLILKNEKLAFISMLNIDSSNIISSSCILFENKEKTDKIPQKTAIKVNKTKLTETMFIQAEKNIQQKVQKTHLKNEYFYQPFLYFTSRQYHKDIYTHIKQFDKYRNEAEQEDSVFSIIKYLYYNMNMLNNHLKVCYYGMRNFRASLFFKPNHTFYLHNFTLAYQVKDMVVEEVSQHSGTLFHIQSTSGKLISEYAVSPGKKQILFAPFTYFLVEKMQKGEKMDEVWLTQVSAPISFKKNIVLWVDDNPRYNQIQYDFILNVRTQIEILQLTSTTAAQKWIKQFGWILSWKGLEFKLISDMGRVQWKNDKKVENREAGIDLLELLYKAKGYSAKTLIFCGDEKRANSIAKKRNIPLERYLITESQGELMTYVGIKDK